MKRKYTVTALAMATCALLVLGAGTLDNGTIRLQDVNGDGTLGDLQYPIGSANHLGDCGLRVRYSGQVSEATEIPSTEMAYDNLDLFTGYGREQYSKGSNYYVCSASYLQPGASYLDQTLVVLTRVPQNNAKLIYYIDPDVMGTKSNDFGYYSSANKMVALNEDKWIGLVADLNGAETVDYAVGHPTEVDEQMQNAFLNQPPQNNVTDMAAAVAWAPTSLDATPKVIFTRVITADNESSAASMTTIETADQFRRVHVPTADRITPKNITFVQLLNKANGDVFVLKGTVDLSQYPTEMLDLYNTDISLFLADYIAVKPNDEPVADKKLSQKFKLEDGFLGKRTFTLSLNPSKKLLSFQIAIKKTTIGSITHLSAADSPAGTTYVPMALVITGNNITDAAKGGKCWIVAKSFPVDFTKKTTTVKGKLKKMNTSQ